MGKLVGKEAERYLDAARASGEGEFDTVIECDKGDGTILMMEEGEPLPTGWVKKRSTKGTFFHCPNHKPKVEVTKGKGAKAQVKEEEDE